MEAEPGNQPRSGEEETAEDQAAAAAAARPRVLAPSFPQGKIKRIMKLDRDIKKATAEATLAISLAAELFLQSLAAGAHAEMSRRGRRVVRGEHVRSAARGHQPTADFLLDCLSKPPPSSSRRNAGAACQTEGEGNENENENEKGKEKGKGKEKEKPLPRGTRRIDQFFQKTSVDLDPDPVPVPVPVEQ